MEYDNDQLYWHCDYVTISGDQNNCMLQKYRAIHLFNFIIEENQDPEFVPFLLVFTIYKWWWSELNVIN